jgi:CheY-like chemotaxis protein
MHDATTTSGARGWTRILVIDDDPGIGRVLRVMLESRGYDVILAEDGLRGGLAAARRQRPDAIVLDLMMPVMDGFAVLEHLKADPRTQGVPVVVLTAVAVRGTTERLQTAGAAACLTKPSRPGS